MTRHAEMMEAFYGARERHDQLKEEVAIGYATEGAEFDETYPSPRLADFMRGLGGTATPEGVCGHGFYAVDCLYDDCRPTPVKLRPSERKTWNRTVATLARERGIYGDVMAVWDHVTRLRESGMTPESAIRYMSDDIA